MDYVLPKHAMSEEDIKLQYITPAVTATLVKLPWKRRLQTGR